MTKNKKKKKIQAIEQRAKMRAEERKTGKIGAEVLTLGPNTGGNLVLTVGPGTGGNQPKYSGEEGLGQKGSVRLPGRLGEKAPAQGSASSLRGDRQTRPRGQTQGDANVGGGDRQTLPCGSSGSDQVGPSRGSWAERGNPPPPYHSSPPEKKDQWQRPSKRP